MKLLVIFPGPEPMWQGGEAIVRRRFPDLDLSFAVGLSEAEPLIGEAEAVMTFGFSPAVAAKAGKLKWIQSMGSGLDRILGLPGLENAAITGVPGFHAPAVSEAALGLMLGLSRDLPQMTHNQANHVWAPSVSRLLQGATVGIVGVGAISEQLARKCKAMEMTVVGVTGAPRPLPHFDRMVARSDLVSIAGQFDYMVLLAALTPETRGMIGREVLEAMKPGAVLINVGRGGLVDEPALIAALQQGLIAGAGLDVFAEEPLAETSPLWDLPNVIVSPHNAGRRAGYLQAVLEIFAANLADYQAGGVAGLTRRLA